MLSLHIDLTIILLWKKLARHLIGSSEREWLIIGEQVNGTLKIFVKLTGSAKDLG
jgi:hypothetical protein